MNVSRRIITTFLAISATAAFTSFLPAFSAPAQASSVIVAGDPWHDPAPPSPELPIFDRPCPGCPSGDPWH